jgi:hypothetical protein
MKNISKLALKMDESIQNLNCLWVGSEIGFSSINFELIGNLFDTKVSIFYLNLMTQKTPSGFNKKCLQISFKNRRINSEIKLFIELILKLVSAQLILN